MRSLFLLFLCLVFLSCSENNAPNDKDKVTEKSSVEGVAFPSIPNDVFKNIVTTADHVDISFYEVHFSISQNNPGEIKKLLTLIKGGDITLPSNCYPKGDFIVLSNGEVLLDGKLFVSSSCGYLISYKDGKPIYGNELTDNGIRFFLGALRGGAPIMKQ